jgi:excisionase family DNA binding protein
VTCTKASPDRSLPDPLHEPTIGVPRAARIIGCSNRAVYEAVERGELPAIRIGRRVFIPNARFLRWAGMVEEPAES